MYSNFTLLKTCPKVYLKPNSAPAPKLSSGEYGVMGVAEPLQLQAVLQLHPVMELVWGPGSRPGSHLPAGAGNHETLGCSHRRMGAARPQGKAEAKNLSWCCHPKWPLGLWHCSAPLCLL